MTTPLKICAVPYREITGELEVLAFKHPLAGKQFVKGSLEFHETPAEGARRELREESGVAVSSRAIFLGEAAIGDQSLTWQFYGFATDSLPNHWEHWTQDDGGHVFSFFWHPLGIDLDSEWHPIFHQAFRRIRSSLPAAIGLAESATDQPKPR